ncbi:MAG: hypothetical protein A2751_05650 [Candidatus Doudnabacteria bacterium RIFCSPHIGHO2_01_FULL_46_14]|uniref:peptide chain release factor N(5)-glutamine methyltransferase n=1 Tax=Candidatus Doudnabacteria bacterium RIFCSPHIGHO2_01_FULL_46_14 TaxID=1817824 RepID=A0A1F5NN91_9BACT|nr:MAG: hypothetical protein A2751_05650 [Candidatus Doudnabacteria bacterium RIFCSPHIGHO2_01_FULL_46_14]
MTIREAFVWTEKKINKADSPQLDAEVLLSHTIKKSKEFLFANPDFKLSSLQFSIYRSLIQKRDRHWPVSYLIGHKEFYGLDFKVTPHVLIPRPETELLVELAIQKIKNKRLAIRNILDIGTGSGCIITSIAVIASQRRSNLKFYATDVSNSALKIAKSNARRHSVAKKIKFLHSNLLSTLPATAYKLPSLILANLPYLTPSQYNSNLDLKHEPRAALVAGPDGLKYYRKLFRQIRNSPNPSYPKRGTPPLSLRGGREGLLTLLLEHDPSQTSKLKFLTKQYFPQAKLKFHRDLSGLNRVLEINL